MKFKEWLELQEVGTGSNAVAVFSRPIFSDPVRRAGHEEFILGGQVQKHHHHKKNKKHDWEGQVV